MNLQYTQTRLPIALSESISLPKGIRLIGLVAEESVPVLAYLYDADEEIVNYQILVRTIHAPEIDFDLEAHRFLGRVGSRLFWISARDLGPRL